MCYKIPKEVEIAVKRKTIASCQLEMSIIHQLATAIVAPRDVAKCMQKDLIAILVDVFAYIIQYQPKYRLDFEDICMLKNVLFACI